MKLKEVLSAFDEGKSIRRDGWPQGCLFRKSPKNGDIKAIDMFDMALDDWEIVEEPKKKKKKIIYPVLMASDGSPDAMLTRDCFSDIETARKWAGVNFIRLATEFPIEIEVDD